MADEEVVRSREWQDEEKNVKKKSSKIIWRNKRGYDNDEKEIDNEADKSRKSRKHDCKERKKEMLEGKEYGSKDMDRLKLMVKENNSGRESEKHGSREKGSSSRYIKEYQGDYEKDRAEPELGQEKHRDIIWAKDNDQINHIVDREHEYAKDNGRKHDKGKHIEHNRERNFDRKRVESRDHGKDKKKEIKYKGKESDKNKDIDHSREHRIYKEHDHIKAITREGEKEKVIDRVRGLDLEHEHLKEQKKVYDHHKDREMESKSNRDKKYDKSKIGDKDHTHEIDKELERNKVKEKDRERGKDIEKGKGQDHYWSKEMEREKLIDREKDKVGERNGFEKHKGKKRHREMEVIVAADQDVSCRRDIERDISRDKGIEAEESFNAKNFVDMREFFDAPNKIPLDGCSKKAVGSQTSFELAEYLKISKEEKINGNSEAVSEVLSWVNKSRKLEQSRNSEKDKALTLARKLDEQDKILDENEDELIEDSGTGVKVLHSLDKVMEGAAVVLTLKDQNIIANGDVNEEVDMLESVEIGEQRRRNEAYIAAKRKTGIYDKFSEDLISRKTILPQYDDPVDDDGVFLDESWRFIGQAEKKLVELRKRIERNSLEKNYADLSFSVGKTQTDYFTSDEMLQFKRSKKKKSLRKKERLDLNALEVEARSIGPGLGDLGTRGDMKRLSVREEEEKIMAEARTSAYQVALTKAEEASKILRQGAFLKSKPSDDDSLVFGEDFEDLQNSLEQAGKFTLKKRDETSFFGPQSVALFATALREQENAQTSAAEDTQNNKVVITEMEEFVLGLQIYKEKNNPESEDDFKDNEDDSMSIDQEKKVDAGVWTEAKVTEMGELSISGDNSNIIPDELFHETAVCKGLSGALKLLKDRGTLKESIDWGGRNMDKKKRKFVDTYANNGSKEICIERTDEFGRILTKKESFRILSHTFHGKWPGKMKQEKRMKHYHEDLKAKNMEASDMVLLSMEKIKETQARLKTPYLVLSGLVKPGQASDPRSGFVTG